MAIAYRPMVATRISECVLALSLLLLLLPRLLPRLLLVLRLLLPQLLLQKTGGVELNTGMLYARRANAVRHQDGVDQRVTTARLQAADLISVLVMLSMSYLPFH